MEREFDREWYEYLQRLFRDREEAKRFAELALSERDEEDEDNG